MATNLPLAQSPPVPASRRLPELEESQAAGPQLDAATPAQLRASIVVPVHNGARVITACLDALSTQTIGADAWEAIVVDDGSTDGTPSIVEQWVADHPDCAVRLVCQDKAGAAAARNRGIAPARSPIVLFTDADCAPEPEWAANLLAVFADEDSIGAKGTYLTTQRSWVARFVQIEYEDKYDLLATQPTIDFIDTYSAAYRRDVLVANNGFDPKVHFVEDQELSFRLAARGYKMVFRPQARVYHLHSDTVHAYARKKFWIGYWKAQIVRRFPTRAVKDSHTPQVLKLQMLLAASALALLAGWPVAAWLGAPAGIYGALLLANLLVFLGAMLPFIAKAWRKDRLVALASPLLLAVRALALGLGYGWGLVRPDSRIGDREANTIGGLNYVFKRGVDVVGSVVGLLFTAIIGPFIALAIRLDSPGPIIFRQERVGQGGRPFTVYKFRSMQAGAEDELARLVDLEALPEPAFKLRNDPRLTRIGRRLRRWSLDELPQFWNVLKGDMSLIGPRPEESWLVQRYSDWHRRRLAVKPGITGPMQVNGRGDLSLDDRVRLELDYIENYSLWRDLVILARTIPAVIRGTGAR